MNKYRLCLWKAYFDKGRSVTNYFVFFLVLFGWYAFVKDLPVEITIILGVVYLMSCAFIGKFWYYHGFMEAEQEVTNHYNLFVIEMREKLNNKKL